MCFYQKEAFNILWNILKVMHRNNCDFYNWLMVWLQLKVFSVKAALCCCTQSGLPVVLLWAYTLCVCAYASVCSHECGMHINGKRVNIGCLPQSLSTLVFRHILSLNLMLTNLARVTDHGTPGIPLSLYLHSMLGLDFHNHGWLLMFHHAWGLCEFWWFHSRALGTHSKHFSKWTVFPVCFVFL